MNWRRQPMRDKLRAWWKKQRRHLRTPTYAASTIVHLVALIGVAVVATAGSLAIAGVDDISVTLRVGMIAIIVCAAVYGGAAVFISQMKSKP